MITCSKCNAPQAHDHFDILVNPPDGFTLKQAEWVRRMIVATIKECSERNGTDASPHDDDAWNDDFDLRKFDD